VVTIQVEDSIMLKSRIKIMIAEYELRTGTKFVKMNAADKLGMMPQQFSALLAGRAFTTAEKMFILANMLGCKVDDLYEYEEE
jgi:plasmid maintenance system antidote protein VapI